MSIKLLNTRFGKDISRWTTIPLSELEPVVSVEQWSITAGLALWHHAAVSFRLKVVYYVIDHYKTEYASIISYVLIIDSFDTGSQNDTLPCLALP